MNNAAKILQDNPTLMRLRELEVLERVAAGAAGDSPGQVPHRQRPRGGCVCIDNPVASCYDGRGGLPSCTKS